MCVPFQELVPLNPQQRRVTGDLKDQQPVTHGSLKYPVIGLLIQLVAECLTMVPSSLTADEGLDPEGCLKVMMSLCLSPPIT